MMNVISQSLRLDVVSINAYAKFYQIIPKGLELSTFFTNMLVTKSSQTVRWQNQMFDYRALYESQPSVSDDFLRVVQFYDSSGSLKIHSLWAAQVGRRDGVVDRGAAWQTLIAVSVHVRTPVGIHAMKPRFACFLSGVFPRRYSYIELPILALIGFNLEFLKRGPRLNRERLKY